MTRATRITSIVLAFALIPSEAVAEDCAEGRALNGACVKPGITQLGRERAVIQSQPFISMSTQTNRWKKNLTPFSYFKFLAPNGEFSTAPPAPPAPPPAPL